MINHTMKLYTTILCVLFTINLGFSQVNQWIEDLKTTEGKAKVDLLNKIGEAYTDESEPYSAKTYLEQALPLAKKLRYRDGEAVANFFMAETYQLLDDSDKAEKYYLRWCKVRKKQGDRQKLIWALSTIANFYETEQNDKRVVRAYKKLLKLRKKNKDQLGIKRVYGSLAHYFKGIRKDGSFKPNWKKNDYYLNLYLDAGVEAHGESFRDRALQDHYDFLIYYTLRKNNIEAAEKAGDRWYKAQGQYKNVEEMEAAVRYIGSRFYDKNRVKLGNKYTQVALDYGLQSEKVEFQYMSIRRATANTRYRAIYLESLRYAIQLWEFEQKNAANIKYPFETAALNAVIAKVYYSKDKTIKKQTIEALKNWQKNLDTAKYPKVDQWITENITFLGNA